VDRIIGRIESHRNAITAALTQADVEIPSDVKNTVELQTLMDVLNWISPLDFRNQQKSPDRQPLRGTGGWFLEDPRFMAWAAGRLPLLWCHGIPGAGKTVLASAAFTHMLEKDMTGKAVLIAYCAFDDKHTQTADSIVFGLLRQVVQLRGELSKPILKIYAGKKRSRPGAEQLSVILNTELQHFSETFIIIDGLDEIFERTERVELLRRLESLKPQNSARPRVKVTSRPLPDIRDWFTSKADPNGFLLDDFSLGDDDTPYASGPCDECYDRRYDLQVRSYQCSATTCGHLLCYSCHERLGDVCRACDNRDGMKCILPRTITIAAKPEDIGQYINWRIDSNEYLRGYVANTKSCDLRQANLDKVTDTAKHMYAHTYSLSLQTLLTFAHDGRKVPPRQVPYGRTR
jgi:hypothetical protein